MSALVNESIMKGVIAEKHNHAISVIPPPECSDKQQCSVGCGACSGRKNLKKITVPVESPQHYKTGTPVTIRHYTINEFVGALVVFGIPLFSACVVLFIWYFVSPESVESGKALFFAAFAFAAGFAVIRIVDIQFRKRYPSQVISYQPPREAPPLTDRDTQNG